MKKKSTISLFFLLLFYMIIALNATQVTSANGGSIQTKLGYGIVLNKDSSLMREWITVHDDSLPIDFDGNTGLKTIYSDRSYYYSSEYTIITKEAISAFEIRFLTFDIWGNHIQNLVATEISDIGSGMSEKFDAKWKEYSENRVSEFYASIAYISQIRTADGRVIKANPETVLAEARKFSEKFSMSDLEPKPDKE